MTKCAAIKRFISPAWNVETKGASLMLGQGPGWRGIVNHRRGTQFERSLMETSSAQCHYHLSTRISSSSNNIYKPNILINLGLILVVYITFHNVCRVSFTIQSLHYWRACLYDMTTELWQMTYSCHRVFMNDVKSEYNTPQQSDEECEGCLV